MNKQRDAKLYLNEVLVNEEQTLKQLGTAATLEETRPHELRILVLNKVLNLINSGVFLNTPQMEMVAAYLLQIPSDGGNHRLERHSHVEAMLLATYLNSCRG